MGFEPTTLRVLDRHLRDAKKVSIPEGGRLREVLFYKSNGKPFSCVCIA